MIRTPSAIVVTAVLSVTSTVTAPAMPSSSAVAVAVDHVVKKPFSPSVLSTYLVTASGPSLRMPSTSSPADSGRNSSNSCAIGYATIDTSRVVRSASSWAPGAAPAGPLIVTVASLSITPTMTATLAIVSALDPFDVFEPFSCGCVWLSAPSASCWTIVATTSRSSLDFSTAFGPTTVCTSWSA